MADAATERPGVGPGPLKLRIDVAAARAVGFVAAQAARDSIDGVCPAAGEVFIATAVVTLAVCGKTQHQVGRADRPARVQVQAGITAVEVDHAATVARAALRPGGNGQPLRHAAAAAVGRKAKFAQGTLLGAVRPGHTQLGLRQLFAGVEVDGLRRRLVRSECKLLSRQAQGVVSRLVQVVQQDGDAVACPLPAQPHARLGLAGGTLGAEAVDLHLRCRSTQIQPFAQDRGAAQPELAQTKAAQIDPRLPARLAHRGAHQRNDATRAVAIEHGKRSAQHLDALGACKVEVRHLALAIGAGGRDAVGDQTQAAHAE